MLTFLAAAALTTSAAAQMPDPRKVADDVAATIEKVYFDPQKARQVAADLRRMAEKGSLDGLDNARLAQRLTVALQPFDRHFRVIWIAPGNRAQSNQANPSYGPEEADRRSGYGFSEVGVRPGNIGYIELSSFAPIDFSDPDWPARKAADAALALVGRTDALVIDLRRNGGGDPSMVGYLVSTFVEPDRDVYNVFHSRQGEMSEKPAIAWSGPRYAGPVYILTSGRTGSAAEAFAYTMQAAGRAKIVGEPSYGAANPGGMMDAGNGWQVFVSMATPINPLTSGNWEGVGVKPDIAVAAANAPLTAQITALKAVLPQVPANELIDTKLTLEALAAEQSPAQAGAITDYAGHYADFTITAGEHGLVAQQGRRMPQILHPVGSDRFFPADSPSTRFVFERAADGTITSLTITQEDGETASYDKAHD